MTTPVDELANAEHVRRYLATDGAEGHDWRGMTVLVLTTTGRRSGTQRRTPLVYRVYGEELLLVASNGGSATPPAWYLNLLADPQVGVQVRGDRFAAVARTASPQERPAMWRHMLEVFPAYADYQRRTAREIPVVVIARRADARGR